MKDFNLLEAMTGDDALFHGLLSCLPLPSLIDLYAISKTFYLSFNRNATGSILTSVRTWSPDAETLFPWRCYRELCIKDPILRQKGKLRECGGNNNLSCPPPRVEDDKGEENPAWLIQNSRDVPSLRWLQMVVWRHGVAQDIVDTLNAKCIITSGELVETIKVGDHSAF